MDKAHREQHQVGGELELAAVDLAHRLAAGRRIGLPEGKPRGPKRLHASRLTRETLRRDSEFPGPALLVRARGPVHERPERPGSGLVAFFRWAFEEFDGRDRFGALAM